jgi:hypothetical protein
MTVLDLVSWIINGGALIGWCVNIKHRKQAMIIFTCTTLLSIIYFALTKQTPFLLRSGFYLVIDIATLYHIKKEQGVNND